MTIYYQHVQLLTCSISNFMTAYFKFYFSLELTKRWHLSILPFMRLLSNQVNNDFEASSNEAIKLSVSLTVENRVLSSATSMLLTTKNKSARKMLKKRDQILIHGVPQKQFMSV